MTSFAEHLPFERFREYALACSKSDENRFDWEEFKMDFKAATFAPAIEAFLKSRTNIKRQPERRETR